MTRKAFSIPAGELVTLQRDANRAADLIEAFAETVAVASSTAWRSVPGPLSDAFVTPGTFASADAVTPSANMIAAARLATLGAVADPGESIRIPRPQLSR
jgi:hypothetical protein